MFVTIVTRGRDGTENTQTFSNVADDVFAEAEAAIESGEGSVVIYDANSRVVVDVSRVVSLSAVGD